MVRVQVCAVIHIVERVAVPAIILRLPPLLVQPFIIFSLVAIIVHRYPVTHIVDEAVTLAITPEL